MAQGKLLWLKNPVARAYKRVTGRGLQEKRMAWRPLLARDAALWKEAQADTKNGPNILIGASLGRFQWECNFDSALAVALTLRGARVHTLLCDKALTACSPWTHVNVSGDFTDTKTILQTAPPGEICQVCYAPGRATFAPLNLPMHTLGALVSSEEKQRAAQLAAEIAFEAMPEYSHEGIAVGEHAIAGTIRFFANADLSAEPQAETVARRYFQSALLTTFAAQKLLSQFPFQAVSGSHGIYVPQGLLFEVARQKNVRVVNWHRAYRAGCLLFSHDDTYHKTMLNEDLDAWQNMAWGEAQDAEITRYLDERQSGVSDWISFNRNPDSESLAQVAAMGIDFSKPLIGMLTNVAWDAQLHYGATPFRDMTEWMTETIRYFASKPELQLLIRVHPAEVTGHLPSRQPSVAEIQKAFPQLPPNVFVIGPESKISTYETMAQCDSVIIYATKTGIELSARGIPVLVAGEAWIKNKGFALDASTQDEYFAQLGKLPLGKRLSPDATRRAKKYAYHFFLRRMIPVDKIGDQMMMNIQSIRELLPGENKGLDIICDGILQGTPFIHAAELGGV